MAWFVDMIKYQTMQFYAQLFSPVKVLSHAKWYYSNIDWEALGILHGLDRFHYDFFPMEVCIITDHKPLVAIISRDVGMPSQCIYTMHDAVHLPV